VYQKLATRLLRGPAGVRFKAQGVINVCNRSLLQNNRALICQNLEADLMPYQEGSGDFSYRSPTSILRGVAGNQSVLVAFCTVSRKFRYS
jgi:hypothetical protein